MALSKKHPTLVRLSDLGVEWMTQSSLILEKSHFAEVPIRMLPGSCEIEFYTARCQRQWATPLPRARVTLEAIIETISRCHALTRTRFLPQWDLEGPTYSKMSARALRVQPGGRPCGAGPVTWPQLPCNAGPAQIAGTTVSRVALGNRPAWPPPLDARPPVAPSWAGVSSCMDVLAATQPTLPCMCPVIALAWHALDMVARTHI